MTKQELTAHFKARGWVCDKWNHLRKERSFSVDGKQEVRSYRVKLQPISCRYEVRTNGPNPQWVRLSGAYYRDCLAIEDGRLKVGSVIFAAVPKS